MNRNKDNALIVAYNDLNNSGVPNVIYQTIKSLHKFYNFDVIVFGDNTYYYDKLKCEGIENINIIKFPKQFKGNIFKKFFWKLFYKNVFYRRKAASLIKKRNYTVIHSFKEYEGWPFFKICLKLGVNKRIFHGTVIHSPYHGLLQKFLYHRSRKLSLKYASDFVGVSELCCKSTFPKKNYSVIYNSYDESSFNYDVKNKLSKNELVLTHLATFNENKNQLFSLNVLLELNKIYPNSKLRLIGKETGPGYLNKINQFILDNNLKELVSIIDGTKGAGSNLEYTTFTLLPSFKEGAGITAIESQACGIPVFASSSVTKEMNAGGMISLDLEAGAAEWAKQIFDKFKKTGNTRIKYDLNKFSNASFARAIKRIYVINK